MVRGLKFGSLGSLKSMLLIRASLLVSCSKNSNPGYEVPGNLALLSTPLWGVDSRESRERWLLGRVMPMIEGITS